MLLVFARCCGAVSEMRTRLSRKLIQVDVEAENVDAGFTQDAELARSDV
jgi:hypothetical protein